MALKIVIRGNNAVLKGLDDYEKRIQARVQEEIRDWALKTESEAKTTPNLADTIKNSVTANVENNGLTWTVGSDLLIAAYSEFGTGAYVEIPPGLEAYARTFYVNGLGTLPANSFLFANARRNFEDTVNNIKKILAKG